MTGGWFTVEASGDKIQLVLVDEIRDAGKTDARHAWRGVEEVRGDFFEAKDDTVVSGAYRIEVLKLCEGPASVLADKANPG